MQILEKAIKLLAKRSYSEREIFQKLCHADYSQNEIQQILEKLHSHKLIDDLALGQHLLEKYCERNKYSLKTIVSKLKQRGLPGDIIAEALAENNYDEFPAAVQMAQQYSKSKKTKEKLAYYLYAKGFSAKTIEKITEEGTVS